VRARDPERQQAQKRCKCGGCEFPERHEIREGSYLQHSPAVDVAARFTNTFKSVVVRTVRRGLIEWARGRGSLRREDAGRPKVYFLLMHAWGMGGTIRTVLNTAEHLSSRYEVEVLGMIRTRDRPFFDLPPGVPLTPVVDGRDKARRGALRRFLERFPSLLFSQADPSVRVINLWTDVQLVRLLRTRRAGVLIGTRPGLNLLAGLVAGPGMAKVGQEHMHLSNHPRKLQRAMRWGYARLDALAVLTESDLREYGELLDGSARVEQIPNAVTPLAGEISDLSSKTVVALGRLRHQKDFRRLIRAFAQVAAKHPDWKLKIFGDGPNRERLEQLIVELGLESNVELPGPVRNVGPELAAASMYALSSRREGFPMVLLEAMSKGLPVVSFDCPTGPREIVRSGENGLLVPHQDVDALAAAMIRMIEDEDLRRRCGAGALATAERYSIDVIGARWEQLLAEVLPAA
jgi:glycosyltransferase involved in cell wall biosynthesis